MTKQAEKSSAICSSADVGLEAALCNRMAQSAAGFSSLSFFFVFWVRLIPHSQETQNLAYGAQALP